MKIYGAIDLMEGRAVRLEKGAFDKATLYGETAVAAAQHLREKGAKRLHVVNLSGALTGSSGSGLGGRMGLEATLSAILELGLEVQFGGGLRTLSECTAVERLGVNAMVIGTAALSEGTFLEEVVQQFGKKITVAVDLKGGRPAAQGWTIPGVMDVRALCQRLNQAGVYRVIHTAVARDGMMQGPDFEELQELQRTFCGGGGVVASGGITTLEDIQRLSCMNIKEAIVGRAVYENRLDLRAAEVI